MPQKNYKTAGRVRIMEYLMDHKDMMVSAADIQQELQRQDFPVNVSTIYRNLDKLVKDGEIMKYASENGERCTYQYAGGTKDCRHHLHLKCTACGMVVHLDCSFMNELGEHILEHHGFVVQCENSMIYGLCSECRDSSE